MMFDCKLDVPALPALAAAHGSAVRAQDKSVRSLPVKCKLKVGQIIVEQSVCGIAFSFPAAVWPAEPAKQRAWVERLTPWWDMDAPDWTPQAHRLRESCCKAINNLTRPAPKTANRWQTGESLPNRKSSPMTAPLKTLESPDGLAGQSLGAAHGSASVLDACCSIRAFWFDKNDPRAVFVDNRRERIVRRDVSMKSGERVLDINPDIVADFTALPFPDNTFALVVFDPPHKKRDEANGGFLVQHYGMLKGEWKTMLRGGFAECFRVLRPDGVLIFKWAETEFPVSEILALTPEKPLFGHKSGKNAGTHWIAFMKPNAPADLPRISDGRQPQALPINGQRE